MAPDITLERGRTYTFVVETGLGSDPDQTFQPVYITSDPSGGHQLKSDFEAKVRQHIYIHCHRSKNCVVCCCKLNNTRDCDDHLFGQVSTSTGCINCRQMCTIEDTLTQNLGSTYFDDAMSYNLLTTHF